MYVVVQNIDDAAPEWILAPATSSALLESFYALFDFLPRCVRPSRGRGPYDDDDDYQDDYEGYTGGGDSGDDTETGGGPLSPEVRKALAAARSRRDAPLPPPPPDSGGDDGDGDDDDSEDEVLGNDWSVVKLLEEYDAFDLENVSRPYAYVADHVVRIDLSASVAEEIAAYEEQRLRGAGGAGASSGPGSGGDAGEGADGSAGPPMAGAVSDEFTASALAKAGRTRSGSNSGGKQRSGWFEKLRDQLQRGEDIRWYVVVCGDEERALPDEPVKKKAPRMPAAAQGQVQAASSSGKTSKQRDSRSKQPPPPPKPRSLVVSDRRGGAPVVVASQQQQPAGGSGPLFPKPSFDSSGGAGSASSGSRPKTPKAGGFRRLFGRSGKGGDATSP